VLNAANEVAVDAFLNHALAFTDIPRVIEGVMGAASISAADTLESVLAADTSAREAARERIRRSPIQRAAAN
jgi:1-deoxy-D-xylulose-5-phosphate reductoisomerase